MAAAVLGILAIVGLVASSVAVWAWATVFDSERAGAIVADALAEPEVEAALAELITEQVFGAVDVDAVIANVLPGELTRLEGALSAGARVAVERAVTRAVASPDGQAFVTAAVDRAHSGVMRLLEGDGIVDGISVTDGEVSLNLLPLVGRGLTSIQDLGLMQNLDVPELTPSGDPAEQIAQLEEATGRQLPDDFGQLVVYRSDRLAEASASVANAQRVFALAHRGVWLLVVLTVLLTVGAVLVAGARWRAALWLGLGGAVAMVVLRAIVHRVVDEAPQVASNPGARAAISSIVGDASASLLRLTSAVLVAAVAIVALALASRRWRRGDLVFVAAVVGFALIIAVLGLNVGSILFGLVAALFVVIAVRFTTRPVESSSLSGS